MSVRVLQVVSALGMGGAETWLMEVLRRWTRDGSGTMDFLLTSGQRGVFDDEAQALGAKLHYLPYGRAHLASFVRDYRRLLRQGRYDAIHDHADYASGWHFLLGAGALPSVRVSHVHSCWLHIEASYGVSPLRRAAAAGGKALVETFATGVCGTSGEILRQYGFEPGRARRPPAQVLHCGFDIGKFNAPRKADRARVLAEFGWPADSRLVLFAGRLDPSLDVGHPLNVKNSRLALDIARAAVARDPAVRLVMAGAGEALPGLRALVDGWGLTDQLRVTGVRDDVPALMRAADALLFPSAQEGLGMVAVEAQAAGLPVLASTAVPREAVVIPGLFHTLPLTEPADSWAEALLETMARPRMATAACREALEASAFSIERSSRSLLDIYGGA